MRVRFTYQELADAGRVYAPLCDKLLEVLRRSNPEIELDYLKGYTYFSVLCHSVIAYDRCFWQLAKNGEVIAAYPLIRLQADTLRVLIAEYLYPNRVLDSIYNKARDFNQIKVNGEKLSPSIIMDKANELFSRFKEIYQRYNQFAHPSIKHNLSWLNKQNTKYDTEAREMRRAHQTIKRTVGEWDMLYLNQCIVHILLLILVEGYKAAGMNWSALLKQVNRSHPDIKSAKKDESETV
ncbi:MAG: hypothetical protein HDS49_04835 [Bacteroides sp.]|nr:hypothetical protein [Bacteroides sp.]